MSDIGIKMTMTVSGHEVIGSKFKRFLARSDEACRQITGKWAGILVNSIKAAAPVETGFYRNSIHKIEEDPYSIGAATSTPYALRLEYGFFGTDSMGRTYSQAPYPHWTPAMFLVKDQYLKELEEASKGWWE